jgi:hypothetical protein
MNFILHSQNCTNDAPQKYAYIDDDEDGFILSLEENTIA